MTSDIGTGEARDQGTPPSQASPTHPLRKTIRARNTAVLRWIAGLKNKKRSVTGISELGKGMPGINYVVLMACSPEMNAPEYGFLHRSGTGFYRQSPQEHKV